VGSHVCLSAIHRQFKIRDIGVLHPSYNLKMTEESKKLSLPGDAPTKIMYDHNKRGSSSQDGEHGFLFGSTRLAQGQQGMPSRTYHPLKRMYGPSWVTRQSSSQSFWPAKDPRTQARRVNVEAARSQGWPSLGGLIGKRQSRADGWAFAAGHQAPVVHTSVRSGVA